MKETTMKIKVGDNTIITFVGEVLYEGIAEQGDGKPCRALRMRGHIVGSSNSDEVTMTFYTPTCKWQNYLLAQLGYDMEK